IVAILSRTHLHRRVLRGVLGQPAAADAPWVAVQDDARLIQHPVAAGDLAALAAWLQANVHTHGSRFGFDDLLRAATGRPLDPAVFIAHLRARYLG
ncbi:MAG: hypothetical protein ACK4ST_12195, partial [Elioraea tepidiphila]